MKFSIVNLSAMIIIAIILSVSVNLSAQNKDVRDVPSFDKVKISDDLKVIFKKSDVEKVRISAEGIGYDKVITESSGRELKLRVKNGLFKDSDVSIIIEYVNLRSLIVTDKADVKFNEVLTGDEVNLKVNNNAVIIVEVKAAAVKASLSNGGRIEISGKANLQEVDANLGSKYNAYEFETENGFIKANTNSDVVVWVKNRLEATSGSKSEVKYKGKPAELISSTNLGGTISGGL
jgi:hypothetical protein